MGHWIDSNCNRFVITKGSEFFKRGYCDLINRCEYTFSLRLFDVSSFCDLPGREPGGPRVKVDSVPSGTVIRRFRISKNDNQDRAIDRRRKGTMKNEVSILLLLVFFSSHGPEIAIRK